MTFQCRLNFCCETFSTMAKTFGLGTATPSSRYGTNFSSLLILITDCYFVLFLSLSCPVPRKVTQTRKEKVRKKKGLAWITAYTWSCILWQNPISYFPSLVLLLLLLLFFCTLLTFSQTILLASYNFAFRVVVILFPFFF